ncbi:ATPase inhibitor subunit zeta [Tropicimonas marinistellae]|uniref:ATPase inhibitor subunit zeta n=1 Tax=Tropicimonas marinistellae TaxID=1739787 RepID=UPI000834E981|nr:ATPase inhibitor subunit zeta [Tropicimonas marinistellae]
MSLFEDRERAIEAKFARDSELDFRARVRAFRFLAVWASTLKGETVAQAREFARSMIHVDVRQIGDEDVVRIVRSYLGELTDEATVRRKMQEFFRESKELLELEKSL